jgi:2-keto-4-pentenoate hydratase/2-oxohepta-3-ene-1,7-dioic acid hydratase in catechol pathway
MKIAVFDDFRVGAILDDSVHDLTPILPGWRPNTPEMTNAFFGSYRLLVPSIRSYVEISEGIPLGEVKLRPPAPAPRQLLAAPLNYQAHRDEMTGPLTSGPGTADTLGFFLKAPGSISDPDADIELPDLPERRMDFEAEIAVIVGRTMKAVEPENALDYVFGYTIVLDMTMRMTESDREERTMRKSFSTFTPMGPWAVTQDEISDPSDLTLKAWRNGELRQDASLEDLIVGVPELLARASRVLPLEPGDVYATGSPAGVGQISPGDTIVVEAPQIGRLEIGVRLRDW